MFFLETAWNRFEPFIPCACLGVVQIVQNRSEPFRAIYKNQFQIAWNRSKPFRAIYTTQSPISPN